MNQKMKDFKKLMFVEIEQLAYIIGRVFLFLNGTNEKLHCK
jgi:hypothetical protein